MHSQTKDLNTPERIKALYEINEQRKAYKLQRDHCSKVVDSLTTIAVEMGEESKEYVSHNMDLSAGLLGLMKTHEAQSIKIAKLEKKGGFWYYVSAGIGFAAGVWITNEIKK